jgi:hypothetical protein
MVTKTEPDEVGQLLARLAELRRTLTGSPDITQLSPVTSFKSPAELIQQEQRRQEDQLMEKVHELKDRRLIFNVPTIAELLDNPEERLVGESDYTFADDKAIIERVQREAEHPQEQDCDDSDAGDGAMDEDVETPDAIIELCRRMENVGMASTERFGPEVAVLAWKFRAEITRNSMRNVRQTTLDGWRMNVVGKSKGSER